jgi:hypothetical protein
MLAFGESGRRRAPPNNSFNPTANSVAFMREACFNSTSRRGGLIRALDTLRIKKAV